MIALVLALSFSVFVTSIDALYRHVTALSPACISSTLRLYSTTSVQDAAKQELDGRFEKLVGTFIRTRFSGFDGLTDMTCNIELMTNFAVKFSGGIDSYLPGYWRAVVLDSGEERLEISHPVLPEMMFFFDLTEPNILWKSKLDIKSMTVSGGEISATKKRFGLIPYTEILGSFEGDLLPISEKTKGEKAPKFSNQNTLHTTTITNNNNTRFLPPEDFEDPYDMKRYPELFNPEYVEWWFNNEEQIAREQPGVARAKSFYVPVGSVSTGSGTNDDDRDEKRPSNDLQSLRDESSKKKSKGGKGSKGMAQKNKGSADED